jgi:hypothetical protein
LTTAKVKDEEPVIKVKMPFEFDHLSISIYLGHTISLPWLRPLTPAWVIGPDREANIAKECG